MANTAWNQSDLSGVTLSGSNLIATSTSSSTSTTMHWVRAADAQATGKFYWEVTMTGWAGSNTSPALANKAADLTQWNAPTLLALYNNGNLYLGGGVVASGFTGLTSGAVVCIALDAGAQLAWFRIGASGQWNGSTNGNPATGAGGVSVTAIGGGGPRNLYPAATFTAAEAVTANFGGSAFTGTVPSGFTSGFTAGATSPTSAVVTQAALEQFVTTSPLAQVTQVALEMWATTAYVFPASGTLGANATLLSAASAAFAASGVLGADGRRPIRYVQGHANTSSGGSTPLAAPVGVGNALCVSLLTTANPVGLVVYDDKSNAYTQADSATGSSPGGGFSLTSFYLLNCTNSPQNVGGTITTGSIYTLTVDEFAGATAIDGHSGSYQASPPATTDAVTSGSFTTTANGDMIWGSSALYNANSPALSVGTGFTFGTGFLGNNFATEYKPQTTAGLTAATFTPIGGSVSYTVGLALRPAGTVWSGSAAFAGSTLNAVIWSSTDITSGLTVSNNGLTVTATASTNQAVRAVDAIALGNCYVEFYPQAGAFDGPDDSIGYALQTIPLTSISSGGSGQAGAAIIHGANGDIWVNGTKVATGTAAIDGHTVGVVVDYNFKMIWFRIDAGNWNYSGTANPSTGVGGFDISGITLDPLPTAPVAVTSATGSTVTANFGQKTFQQTVPSGVTKGQGGGKGHGTVIYVGAASFAASGVLGANMAVPRSGAGFSGTGALSAQAAVVAAAGAALSGTGVLGASLSPVTGAALAGQGSLSAGAALSMPVRAQFAASGLLGASTTVSVAGAAGLTGIGSLGATAVVPAAGSSAIFTALGLMSASLFVATFGNAALAGVGSLSAVASVEAAASAALAGSGSLAAFATTVTTVAASASMNGQGTLTAVVSIIGSASAVLIGEGNLSSTGSMVAVAGVGLAAQGVMVARAQAHRRGVNPRKTTIFGRAQFIDSLRGGVSRPSLMAGRNVKSFSEARDPFALMANKKD